MGDRLRRGDREPMLSRRNEKARQSSAWNNPLPKLTGTLSESNIVLWLFRARGPQSRKESYVRLMNCAGSIRELLAGGKSWGVREGGRVSLGRTEKSPPARSSDWTSCAKGRDLINNESGPPSPQHRRKKARANID